MIALYIHNIIRFVLVILIQIFVFDNIRLGGYLNPYFYVIFILLLPFETPKWILLVTGFFLGFCVDIFYNTYGMHAASTVLMAFFRPLILKAFSPRDGYETGTFPRIFYFGLEWFLKYSLLLILIHHSFLFFIEVFRFAEFFHTFTRVTGSTLLTTFLVVISQYFIFRK